jgi:hypothetical protein
MNLLRFGDSLVQATLNFSYHPSEDVRENYAFHRLSEEETASFEEHLLLCDSCQNALEETDQFILLVKAAAADPAPQVSLEPIPLLGALKAVVWGGSLGAVILAILATSWRPELAAAPVPVTLASLRGTQDASMAHAPSRRPFVLAIEAADLPLAGAYGIEIVSAAGKPVWKGSLTSSNINLSAAVPARLDPGMYWVRLYARDSELLREFGLTLE